MPTQSLDARCLDSFLENFTFDYPIDGRGLGLNHDEIVHRALTEIARLRRLDTREFSQ